MNLTTGSHHSWFAISSFRTQKWSDWVSDPSVNYPYWSNDTQYVYYDNFGIDNPKWHRVKVGQYTAEDVCDLSGLRRYFGFWGVVGRPGAG